MKNLSEYRDGPSAPRVPRSGGHDPFRFRKIATYDRQKKRSEKEWKRHEPEEYRAASLRKLMLGRLPRRMAKYDCADFDLSERCEYAGDDGAAVTGSELAGIAAHIVRCAKHPVDYLFSLRNVPAKLVEPIKAYLRVKLAMGRLTAEIEANVSYSSNISCPAKVFVLPKETLNQDRDDRVLLDMNFPVIPEFASQISGTSRGQYDGEEEGYINATILSTPRRSFGVPGQARDDRNIKSVYENPPLRSGGGGPELLEQKLRVGGGGAERSDSEPQLQDEIAPFERSAPTSPACGGRKPQPSFKWHTSPAKTHNFKELTQTYGYDPRGTSVYWIEKRANALRRKWKKHGQKMRGEALLPKSKPRPKTPESVPENSPPKIKHFTPADIDYNSVWPPVEMPGGPPKPEAARTQDAAPRNDDVRPRAAHSQSGENLLALPQNKGICMTPDTKAAGDFQKLYTPQSTEYLHDYRAVMDKYFSGTDDRIGWYEPWQAWIVTSHDLCKSVMTDERLTPNFMRWKFAPPEQDDAGKNDFERMLDNALFRLERLPHRRVRRLASKAFSARFSDHMQAQIHDVITAAFDKIEGEAVFDVSSTLSVDIPRGSIARLVGVSPDQDDVFNKLGWAMVRYNGFTTTPEDRQKLLKVALEGVALLQGLINERRALDHPGDDFIGLLLQAQEGDDTLNDWEILGIVAAMLAAGSDTASDMHPSLIYALLSHPDQYQKLIANPELVENAITEALRFESFGKTGLHRYALEDVNIGGIDVAKGEQIIIAAHVSGLDPDFWDAPQSFDIARNLNGNIVFGAGAHVCAGLFVAKTQARLMLLEFIKRFPNASLAARPERDPDHYNARHVTQLLVKTGR